MSFQALNLKVTGVNMRYIRYLVFLLGFSLLCCGWKYSDGDRYGVITKYSKKGFVIKTWEGQLNLGAAGQQGDGGLGFNTWDFTVTDEKLNLIIMEAMQKNYRVRIRYKENLYITRCQGETNYFVQHVEIDTLAHRN